MTSARLHRFVLAHLCTVVMEWAAIIGALVHAYQWGGADAVGLVALAIHSPTLIAAPVVAQLTHRFAAHSVRVGGFVVQVAAYGAAAIAAAADAPSPAVAAFVAVGLGGIHTLRPSGAGLLPAIARSTSELVTGNLRVSYCDAVCGLVGPLVAAGLLSVGDVAAVFAACALGALLALLATLWKPSPLGRARPVRTSAGSTRVLREVFSEARARRWTVGVLGVSAARNLIIGAFDVLLVVLALQALDLGDGGPGLLSALVGGGAAASVFVITVAVRRARLRHAMSLGLLLAAGSLVGFGVATSRPAAFVALPVLGVCLSVMENLSRMLLQRSTDPRRLGPLFAGFGFVGGVTQLVGVGVAQGLLLFIAAETALIVLGVLLVAIAVLSMRPLRDADAHADVPVVEMALLSSTPLFAPLPAASLEAVARSGVGRHVMAGEVVIRQGESGDEFYAVAAGEFDIAMNGVHIRTAPRGDFFGEVALLHDAPRTATVTALTDGELLVLHRDPFLLAVTGHEAAHSAASRYVVDMNLEEKMRRTSDGTWPAS